MPKHLILKEDEHKLLLIQAVRRCAGGCSDGCGGSGLMNKIVDGVYQTPDPENISTEMEIDIHGTYHLMVKNDKNYTGPLPKEKAITNGLLAFRKHLNRCPIYRTFEGADEPFQIERRGNEKVYYCPFYRMDEMLKDIINNSELELRD